MKNYFFLVFAFFLLAAGFVLAESIEKIAYPIPELGDCQNKEDCRNYCDRVENLRQCYDFSKKHQLIPGCELAKTKNFLDAIERGLELLPCESKEECKTYCSKQENLNQCLEFALTAEFMNPTQALLIKRTGGKGPGGCQGKECKTYCQDQNNLDECLKFALDYGFITEKELSYAMEIRDIADQGGPGECQGLKECAEYCSNPDNLNACVDFLKEKGKIDQEEIEEIKELAENGGPGGCKNKKECKEFCEDTKNSIECLGFMAEKNYLSEKDIEKFEQKIKEAEELIKKELEKYKEEYEQNFDAAIEQEEIQEEIEKALKPYKEIIENYNQKNSE